MCYRGVILLPLLATMLAGCQTIVGSTPTTAEEQFVATDEPSRVGREHFARGDYGLAQRNFQVAVERAPLDGDAWVGLAASYDHLGRFDLADRAYERATHVKGSTVQLLNNRGYSYLLRGDASRANAMFRQARVADPGSRVVANNIQILRSVPR